MKLTSISISVLYLLTKSQNISVSLASMPTSDEITGHWFTSVYSTLLAQWLNLGLARLLWSRFQVCNSQYPLFTLHLPEVISVFILGNCKSHVKFLRSARIPELKWFYCVFIKISVVYTVFIPNTSSIPQFLTHCFQTYLT